MGSLQLTVSPTTPIAHHLLSANLSEDVVKAENATIWGFCPCTMASALPAASRHVRWHFPCLKLCIMLVTPHFDQVKVAVLRPKYKHPL